MIALVSTIKDEDDILWSFLNHYKRLGIEAYYIIDHNSSDKSNQILTDFAAENPNFFVHVEIEKDVRYFQAERITKLCDLAYRNGSKWVLPVDADEFLQSEQPIDIIKTISQIPHPTGYINIEWKMYWPTIINTPYLSEYCEKTYDIQHKKVLCKWSTGAQVCQGNHLMQGRGQYPEFRLSSQLYYAHFKYRSINQLRKKIVNLGQAYEPIKNTFYHEESIMKWERFKKYGDFFINEFWNLHCVKDQRYLEHRPLKDKLI